MKKIYLVRHGQSEWNTLKKIQGQQDIALTKKGIQQTKLIGSRLIHEKIDTIYSSDLVRASKTAENIGNILNVKVREIQEFREINFGEWEGLSNDILIEKYNKEYLLWKHEPERLKLKGAETLEELQNRAMKGINKIINEDDANNILIVSHSATLKTIILGLLNVDISHFKNLTLGNVSLSIIEKRDYNRVLLLLNDMNHLKESL